MKRIYLGKFIGRNWISCGYNAIGLPIQFGAFYIKRFLQKNIKSIKKRRIIRETSHKRNLFYGTLTTFYEPLITAGRDIKKTWRILMLKTGAGITLKRWFKAYEESDYTRNLKQLLNTEYKQTPY